VALLGMLLAASSLFIFDLITKRMYDNNPSLLIFDLRNGYTSSEVAKTLSAWGHQGRLLYVLIEAIDVTFYCRGYRALFLVVCNRVMDYFCSLFLANKKHKYANNLRYFALFPIILSFVDHMEDFFQVAMTLSFDMCKSESAQSKLTETMWWPALVQCASFVNKFKWGLVRGGSSLLSVFIATNVLTLAYVYFIKLVQAFDAFRAASSPQGKGKGRGKTE